MPLKRLKDFLEKNHVRYDLINHSKTYTAQEIAASAHIPGKEVAKTVIVKVDGKMAMVVLPASYRVDFNMLREALGTKNVEMASEEEFRYLFPRCEVGAMPPFGNLYNMGVFVADSLTGDEEISFNAGTHTELLRMGYKDFDNLVHPVTLKFSYSC